MTEPSGGVVDPPLDEDPPTKARYRWALNVQSWPSDRRNQLLLGAAAAGFLIYQLVAIGLRYPYTTDEAIYLSQFNPDVPSFGWAAWRAWGPVVLATPVALANASLTVVRLYFVILSTVGLFLAFRPWLRATERPLAPLAAALFGGTAVTVYNGSLDLPNYYTALGAIAATGYFVACRRGTDNYRWSVVGLAVAIAFSALVRPSDSAWLVVPLGLAWVGLRAWRRPAVAAAIAAGQLAGWAPWLIESFIRFNGPVNRLHLASVSSGTTRPYLDVAMVRIYIRLWSSGHMGAVSLNVPQNLRGGSATVATVHLAPVGSVAVLWWIAASGAIVVSVISALLARRTADTLSPLIMVPLAVGLSVAFPYLFMMRYGQLRFLLPVVGLIAVPVAHGVLQLGRWRRPKLPALGVGLAVALVLVLVGVQVDTARQYRSRISGSDRLFSPLVQRLPELGISRPCVIAGYSSVPVAYQVGCLPIGSINNFGREEPAAVASALAEGEKVAIILRTRPPAGTFLDRWRLITVPIRGSRESWLVYLPSTQ